MKSKTAGFQRWSNLAFLHWRIDSTELQKRLPEGLEVETFDGSAWLAVVPFSMERVRPWWSPAVPGISWFLETNVRTYVRHSNGQSGVWFFSLDANHKLAVWLARNFWHLNYVSAKMDLEFASHRLKCSGARYSNRNENYDISLEIDSELQLQTAAENSLEFFLLERYHLFCQRPDGRFLTGEVHHTPYPYVEVNSVSVTQTLTAAYGFPLNDLPDHAAFSPGVNVRVSPLELVPESS